MAMASANGDCGNAFVEGAQAIACALGYQCVAKGTKGSYLVLTERGKWNGICYPILHIQAVQVDGNEIKENTYYKLENNRVMEDR